MQRTETMQIGVVVEQRDADDEWSDHTWHAVSVIPGASDVADGDWIELSRGEGWVRFHAATLPLELFRRETEGYKYNLSLEQPSVFVLLREDDEPDRPEVAPALVTVCPYEAQAYHENGDDIIDKVPMPEAVMAWVAEFVERHHVDEPFVKRKPKRWKKGDQGAAGANGRAAPDGGADHG